MDNKPSIWWQRAMWFWGLLAIVPVFLPLRTHYDHVFERRAAVFRVGFLLLGTVGLAMTALVKRILFPPAHKKKKALNVAPPRLVMPLPSEAVALAPASALVKANPWDSEAREAREKRAASVPPLGDEVPRLRLAYQTEASGFWQIDPWSLLRHGATQFAAFGLPAIVALFVSRLIWRMGGLVVAETAVCIFVGWWLFIGVMGWVEYKKHFPSKNTVRHCEVTLTPVGFYDVTPTKASFVRWSAVSHIRQHKDKIYLYSPAAQQAFPIFGFATETDAQTFFDAAQTLWKSRGRTVPDALQVPSSPIVPVFDL